MRDGATPGDGLSVPSIDLRNEVIHGWTSDCDAIDPTKLQIRWQMSECIVRELTAKLHGEFFLYTVVMHANTRLIRLQNIRVILAVNTISSSIIWSS